LAKETDGKEIIIIFRGPRWCAAGLGRTAAENGKSRGPTAPANSGKYNWPTNTDLAM